ncbi:MAG: fasciclin domain-containing protein, partial [Rubricoccaceae bacterium]|nr:fasciclin domain-containing protein [Rubricoccaceae bacterium]
EGTVESLLLPENQDQLVSILTYHVVSGEVRSSDLLTTSSATTVNGQNATFGLRVGDANVTAADIEASNGVIHVIDRVLLP